MGAHPSVDLFDQSGLIDDAGYDAQVVNILHFYTWSIRCFVHAPQNTSPAKRTCGMWVAELVRSAFAVVSVSPTRATVFSTFLLITRWQSTVNFTLQQDILAVLRRRLYQTIVSINWLIFSWSRPSDFTHASITVNYRARQGRGGDLVPLAVTDKRLVGAYLRCICVVPLSCDDRSGLCLRRDVIAPI